MTKHQVVVTQKREERLPDWAAQFVMVISAMRQTGLLDEISRRLRVPRQGGYSDVDIVVFLVCFLCSAIDSIKEFGRRSQPFRTQLAALADRQDLPTPSSVSRYLNGAKLEHVEPFVDQQLLSLADSDLLKDERSAWRCSRGKRWWIFDWDPTVMTVRKRGLPVLESLPEATRRAAQAQPGYPGRKRGEVQYCRSIVQHTATCQPLGLRVQPGNGDFHQMIAHAVSTVGQAVERAGLARRQAVVRADGVGGCVAFIHECQKARLRALARLSRYHWLDSVQVGQHLDQGDWEVVEDSGSGPVREAMDLGWVKIHPDRRSTAADGSPLEPVRARVVISRFRPREAEGSTGSGRLIDGLVYEMYVTDLDATSWSCSDIVRLYYARAGCENHYAQMIREQKVNRLFCYEPAGQLLVSALALWLFGKQAQWGAGLDDEPRVEQPQWPRQEPEGPDKPRCVDDDNPRPPSMLEVLQPDRAQLGEKAPEILTDAEAEEVLKRFESDTWRWDSATQAFVCPGEQVLTLRKVREGAVIFAASRTACRGCPFRGLDGVPPRCTRSEAQDFRKEIWVKLDAERIAHLDLDKLRELRPAPRHRIDFEPIMETPGPLRPSTPALAPARYRRRFRQAYEDVEVEVEVEIEPCKEAAPPIRTMAELRQRRRQSWEQRHLKGALRHATVHLTVRGGPALEAYFASLDPTGDDGYLVEIAS